jgi:hypothetical protein
MGMLGKLFDDGKSLRDESDQDGEGKLYRPRFDIDLDSGVVRMPNRAAQPAPAPDDTDDSAADRT